MEKPGVEYVYPHSIQEAVELLTTWSGEARIIAGGTDVLPDMRKKTIDPRCLVDITRIPGLNQVSVGAGWIVIGAAVSFAAIKDSPLLNQRVHALVDAARSVGTVAIQNAATWVGNIVQAMPAADGAIVAVALEAEARIVDGVCSEWRPVASLFCGPGVTRVDPTRQFVTHIRFPHPGGPWGTAWNRVGRRPSLVLPILNCAVKLSLDADCARIGRATIALGPVAPGPHRARAAETFLLGQPPQPEVFARATQLVQQEANPRDSIMRASRAYRLSIIPPMVCEALETAALRAQTAVQ